MTTEWLADFNINYLTAEGYAFYVDGDTGGYRPFQSIKAATNAMLAQIADLESEDATILHVEISTPAYEEMAASA